MNMLEIKKLKPRSPGIMEFFVRYRRTYVLNNSTWNRHFNPADVGEVLEHRSLKNIIKVYSI